MFEFILAYSKNRDIRLPDLLHYDETIHTKKRISFGSIELIYQSLKKDNIYDYYEDKNQIIVLYGSIFSSINSNLPSQINAQYLAQHDYLMDEPEKYLRGNYSIIKYDKTNDEVNVTVDPLGLKPIYVFEKESTIYLTSSLWLLAKLKNSLDEEGILEVLLFGYNITEKTIFKSVYSAENGIKLKIKQGKIYKQKYFGIDQLLTTNTQQYDLEEFRILFNSIVHKRINEENISKEIIVTLTGGNDGRAVLSSLYYWKRKFITFSFGMKNGENTLIPELIASKLNFNHQSIYLENSFIDEYYNNAIETINLSDGNLSFEQQSTLYAHKKLILLLNKSLLLTGLIAGEILGPIHLKHDYFNEHYFNLILEHCQLDENYLKKYSSLNIVRTEFFNRNQEYLVYTISERKKQISVFLKQPETMHLAYYFDLINLGFRKFYGMQMHLIRYYAENLPVFYDLDILNYILSTNYHHVFKNSFQSLLKRWKSRIPQSYITSKNYPPLGKFNLDRGFPPINLLHPIKKYLTFLPYLKRKYITMPLHKDFDSPSWCLNYLSKIKFDEIANAYLVTSMLQEYISKLRINKSIYNSEINKIISTYSFLNESY